MDTKEMLAFYRWVTNISLVLFISFSYFYYSSISTMQNELNDLDQQIETDKATIDNTTNNTTKIQLIKASIAKAENHKRKALALMIYQSAAILFLIIGILGMGYGLLRIKGIVFPAPQKKE